MLARDNNVIRDKLTVKIGSTYKQPPTIYIKVPVIFEIKLTKLKIIEGPNSYYNFNITLSFCIN